MRPARIHTVVKVERLKPVKSHNLVELGNNAVKVIYNIVAAVPDVAAVHTDSKNIFQRFAGFFFRPVDYRADFLKCPPDFRAFSCHSFYKDYRSRKNAVFLALRNDFRKHCRSKIYSDIRTLLNVTSRVKIIQISRRKAHTMKVVYHKIFSELPKPRICRTWIHSIRRVRNQRRK